MPCSSAKATASRICERARLGDLRLRGEDWTAPRTSLNCKTLAGKRRFARSQFINNGAGQIEVPQRLKRVCENCAVPEGTRYSPPTLPGAYVLDLRPGPSLFRPSGFILAPRWDSKRARNVGIMSGIQLQ